MHGQARAAQRRGEDVVILSVGDPEFSSPEGVVQRAVSALREGDTHYSDVQGRPELRAAVADHVGTLVGVPFQPSNVMIGAGTQNALFNASLCLLGVGDEVIVSDPSYLTYEATLRIGGAELVPVPQPANTGFRVDPDAVRAAVTARSKAIMVNSPSNPMGTVATPDEIAAIAAVALEHDLWVLSDEVYAELVFDGQHHSPAGQPGMKERTVIVGGLSKSHAMTGWRLGWAVGPTDLIEHMYRVGLAMNYGLPGFIQAAGITAIRDHAADVDSMRAVYRRRRDLVASALAPAPGVEVLSPQAGMFVLADVRGTGLTSAEFSEQLFERTRTSVLDAANFGEAADGWVRISFTIDDRSLDEGCRRIVEFCSSLNQ